MNNFNLVIVALLTSLNTHSLYPNTNELDQETRFYLHKSEIQNKYTEKRISQTAHNISLNEDEISTYKFLITYAPYNEAVELLTSKLHSIEEINPYHKLLTSAISEIDKKNILDFFSSYSENTDSIKKTLCSDNLYTDKEIGTIIYLIHNAFQTNNHERYTFYKYYANHLINNPKFANKNLNSTLSFVSLLIDKRFRDELHILSNEYSFNKKIRYFANKILELDLNIYNTNIISPIHGNIINIHPSSSSIQIQFYKIEPYDFPYTPDYD